MPPAEPGQFRKLGERVRIKGDFLTYVQATFVDPNGFTFERDIVRHPGAVCIVPLEDDQATVRMLRQYRGAVDRLVLELPAGKLDVPGEEIAHAARRELIEEIGADCRTLSFLGTFYNSPGFTDEATHCYLAEGLIETVRDTQGPEEAHMSIEKITLDEVAKLFSSGELSDAKSLIALQLARATLEDRATRR